MRVQSFRRVSAPHADVPLKKRLPTPTSSGSVTTAVAIIRGFQRMPLNAPFRLDTDIRQVMAIPAATASEGAGP